MVDNTRGRGFDVRDDLVKSYRIEEKAKATFFIQVDWLIENAVYPLENGYADNLKDLWNVYMPGYEFSRIVLEYSKKYFPVLRYVHNGETSRFNSVKILQECAIKNYVKYSISQGKINRMELIKDCFELFKDITDRTKLYDNINQTIEHYSVNGEIEQNGIMFLRRFQNYSEQPYIDIVERLTDIHEQKEQALSARPNLLKSLEVNDQKKEEVYTLLNVLLCRIAMAEKEGKFSDVLKDTWNKTICEIPYTDQVYVFIEKYEKVYMTAQYWGIKNLRKKEDIRQLYKDAIILCAVLQAIESGNKYGYREVKDYWKHDGMHFLTGGFFFEDEYDRMKNGFDPETLMKYKKEIMAFHDALIEKIEASDYSANAFRSSTRESDTASEMNHVALNEKARQIGELQERISELEEKVDNTEKEVLSQFISLLDSKIYDHVLGKLYRTAYLDETVKTEDIKRILKNLFEIMNISGIDIYGELESKVSPEEIRRGKYRVDHAITKEAKVKYPGYRVGNSVILHPLAEEVLYDGRKSFLRNRSGNNTYSCC